MLVGYCHWSLKYAKGLSSQTPIGRLSTTSLVVYRRGNLRERVSLLASLLGWIHTCRLRRLSRRRGPVNCSSETVESCVLRAAPCSLTSVPGTGPDTISLLRYPNMKCHCPVVSAMQLDHNNSATMIEAESKFVYLIKQDPHGVKTRLVIGKVASMDGCLRSARFSIREALLFNHIRTRSARVPSLSIDPIGLPMASH